MAAAAWNIIGTIQQMEQVNGVHSVVDVFLGHTLDTPRESFRKADEEPNESVPTWHCRGFGT